MKYFSDIGAYFLLMKRIFHINNWKIYKKQFLNEVKTLGIESLGIVAIVSLFVGAAVVLQLASNLGNPLYPRWITGFTSRKGIMLEFAPTMISLILAGKIGSRIASELGSMRISEQIDALDIMGVNSASYLILPKLVACLFFSPIIIIISVFLSLLGGLISGAASGLINSYDYIYGLQLEFSSYDMFYAIIKGVVYAFIIASISGYRGYTVQGGALDVGRASTKAVVESSTVLIISNLVLTQLLL